MRPIRKPLPLVLLVLALALPLPGCTGPQGRAAFGSLAQLALGVGASVGTYFLIRELR